MDTVVVYSPAPGPSSGVTFSDDFNRSDEDLATGANYSALETSSGVTSPIGITSNKCRFEDTSGTFKVSSVTIDGSAGLANNQRVYFTYSSVFGASNTTEIFVGVRHTSGTGEGTYYKMSLLHTNGGGFQVRLQRVVAGSATTIISPQSITLTASDKLGVEVVGTDVRIIHDTGGGFSTIHNVTDANISSGDQSVVGAYRDSSARYIEIDNLVAEDV